MILLHYLVVGLAIGGIFVVAWITVLMLIGLYLENLFAYCHTQADYAMLRKEFDTATYYNERLQTIAKRIRKVDQLLYFQFFG